MIDKDRYCLDKLQQMQAIKSALLKVEDTILKGHTASCVESVIYFNNSTEQKKVQ